MDNETTNRIKQLLAKFYDGTSSPAEEAELEALTKEAQLPPEIATDSHAFLLCRQPGGIEVPGGLRERLETAIDRRAKTAVRPRRFIWLPLAAAAMVAIALILPGIRPSDRHATESGASIIARSEHPKTHIHNTGTATTDLRPAIPDDQPAEQTETKPAAPQKASHGNTPTRVVTDPREAAALLAQTLQKVGKSREAADKHLADCNRRLSRVEEIITKTIRKDDQANPT